VEEAVTAYERAIEVKPESLQAYLLLAQLHIKSEAWDEAASVYQLAIDRNPNAVDAYSGLGYVHSQTGDLELALAAYSAAVDLRPDSFNERKNLAILYQQMGYIQDAIREGTRALELAPADQKTAIEGFLAQLGAVEPGALAEADEAVQRLIAQGSSQMGAEDWAAAEETFEAVLDLAPDSPYAHSALAYVYARQGRLEEAIAQNEVVVELLPEDYNSFKNLALLYEEMGDLVSAIRATERAIPLAPDNELQALQAFLQELTQRQGESSSTGSQIQPAGDLSPADRNQMYLAPPPVTIEPGRAYKAIIETEKGNIVLELYAARVPEAVNNFVFLAREGFYDDTTFHRVIPGFMAQAGDPTGTGAGGPGYAFPDEFDATLRHDGPGVLSMANAGPDTNGSQFFITYEAAPWLDAKHTVFGRVIAGMDVLESLDPRDPQQNPDVAGDRIRTITIQEE
jgi:cyclophilin family peptidyl-prolyl cis-trans isomerase/Flp pilus assembly protein TadD